MNQTNQVLKFPMQNWHFSMFFSSHKAIL